ncbi:hypothetical protein PVOR_07755 [Paenibacillus vortex V453]|jgi:hypothetical protein|uniref:Uncharacterized protein n=2 Tax=Paenibacillus TaxID=44249 RepID=A0A163KCQ3_9BACL|nr:MULTISPECIES: hypothetical protein [Paenibacillus]ANA81101.1 hypothetical protein A3958_14455 [Paenibacillus glucanolyticus]AVV54781.1 hypothetical protein C7121_00755 [Paenibacillus glucanolyticus]EFU42171.1 hypothetical protein PVOR_07755 [Paenibacillus vortex V453]ETT33732.1 hypothetical protein C169_21978 [Paenibacillus sp. FSL R5-808]KZS47137.1 hypothetical protein AWU65_14990 [Paenibacillus glucanolyticus]
MKKKISLSLSVILLVAMLAFSPWITESFAKTRAMTDFEKKWESTSDGCGFNCSGCGFLSSKKVMFGRNVELAFACGLSPTTNGEMEKTNGKFFVSFLGTVH